MGRREKEVGSLSNRAGLIATRGKRHTYSVSFTAPQKDLPFTCPCILFLSSPHPLFLSPRHYCSSRLSSFRHPIPSQGVTTWETAFTERNRMHEDDCQQEWTRQRKGEESGSEETAKRGRVVLMLLGGRVGGALVLGEGGRLRCGLGEGQEGLESECVLGESGGA